jgi:hypothetical protein
VPIKPPYPDYPNWPPDPEHWPNWNDPRVNTDLRVLATRITELAQSLQMEVMVSYQPQWSAGILLKTQEGNKIVITLDGDLSRDLTDPWKD